MSSSLYLACSIRTLVKAANLVLREHNLFVHTNQRFYLARFLVQFHPQLVQLQLARIRRTHQRREQNCHRHHVGGQHCSNRDFQLAPRISKVRHYFPLLSAESGT
jgi:hypothetical protein